MVGRAIQEFGIQSAILLAAHAYVGESTQIPSKYYRNNVSAPIAFLDCLLEWGVKTIVFSSSCSIYGTHTEDPIREDSPKLPLSPYAETKLFLENVLRWYSQAYGLRSVCLRYFNAAGADPDGEIGESHDPETHLIPLTMHAALGGPPLRIMGEDYSTPDGTAIRDYVHVTDLADAHVRALRYLVAGGATEQLNCGTGAGHSVQQVVAMVEKISGMSVPVLHAPRREGDAAALVADAQRIQDVLQWTPRHSSLETIVDTAWQWHSSKPLIEVARPAVAGMV